MKDTTFNRIIFACAILCTLTLLALNLNQPTVIQSRAGCCSIVIEKTNVDEYTVTWIDNLSDDSYTELVEVEYPEADVSLEEQLAFELDWTVNEFMDFCYTQHGPQ